MLLFDFFHEFILLEHSIVRLVTDLVCQSAWPAAHREDTRERHSVDFLDITFLNNNVLYKFEEVRFEALGIALLESL